MKPAEAARAIASDLGVTGTPVADEIARAFGMYADALDLPDVPGVASADDGATTITLRVPAGTAQWMANVMDDLSSYAGSLSSAAMGQPRADFAEVAEVFAEAAQTLRERL